MRIQKAFSASMLSFLAILGFLLTGCGQVHLGTSANDTAPSGTLVASKQFGGGTVSGTAQIYNQGSGSYILRLVSYVGPSGVSNVGAVVTGNGTTLATIALTVSSGTKNYSFSAASSGITFNSVTIRGLSNSTDYDVASF